MGTRPLILFARRASAILFNMLVARRDDRPFILPANVCPIVPLTFLKARRPYRFADINPDSLCLDESAVIERVRKGPNAYSGVLFVRTYGISGNPDGFFRKLRELSGDLAIIDDKCLCVPEVKRAKDSVADVELFSTGYSKYVDLGWGGFAYADEGIAYSPNAAAYDRRALEALTMQIQARLQGRAVFEYHDAEWLDLATPEMGLGDYFAEITSRLPAVSQQKERLNAVYQRNLPEGVKTLADGHSWRYNVLVAEKERLLTAIFEAGLFASSHFASLGGVLGEGHFSHAENLHRDVVNFFNDLRFSEEQALRVCQLVRDHCQARRGGGRA